VRFFEVRGTGPPTVPTADMTIWLYLPEGPHAPRSLPCVVIAPAGSTCYDGKDLANADAAEHFPYVAAGYAVLAYSVDGDVAGKTRLNNPQFAPACERFIAARGGLANAEAAVGWMLANAPEVDPERLYAAGHSSAGTLALFAPLSNIKASKTAPVRKALARSIPHLEEVYSRFNPAERVADLHCPVLLFQAADDGNILVGDTEAFAATLKKAGKDVTLRIVQAGGHYRAMIRDGIPLAIAFFKQDESRATR